MTIYVLAVLGGLIVLTWSADRFVDAAAAVAGHAGVPPLLIGMLVLGFGTSAPEMVVSAFAAFQGNPGLALGNAYGSNIANIALILGIGALIAPIAVQSNVLRRELPILLGVTVLAAAPLLDGYLGRPDAVFLLAVFAGLMGWSIRQGLRRGDDSLAGEVESELAARPAPLRRSVLWLIVGLALLIGSSRALVWGAVGVAQAYGISDLIIGLTIVAIGTSLPELAATVAAARKGEHDLALGNVIGSNLFNTLMVVGIAGLIHPLAVAPELLRRDWLVAAGLTTALFVVGYGFGGPGRINRLEGGALLAAYIAYTTVLIAMV